MGRSVNLPRRLAAEFGGGMTGVLLVRFLYPASTPAQAAMAVVPHDAAAMNAAPVNTEPLNMASLDVPAKEHP